MSLARLSEKEVQQLHETFALHQQGQLAEAVRGYKKLLRKHPSNPLLLTNLGVIECRLRNLEEGLRLLRFSLTVEPNQPDALAQKALALFELGRLDEALADCDRAIALSDACRSAHVNRGLVMVHKKRYEEALASFDRALSFAPGDAKLLSNRGVALAGLKRFDEALADCRRAIELAPDFASAYVNLGIAHWQNGQSAEAISWYDKAISLSPSLVDAYLARGNARCGRGEFDAADLDYDEVLRRNPHLDDGRWAKALTSLLKGDFAAGWKLYESRWQTCVKERKFGGTRWLGKQGLLGKRILVHHEQGLGDTLQFCRLAPVLVEMGAQVFLEVQPPLLSLVKTLSERITVIAEGDPLPEYDLHTPLLSLPLLLDLGEHSIPGAQGYLSVLPEKREQWAAKLGVRKKLRVGLAWTGNKDHGDDDRRSIAFEQMRQLLDLPVEFHSLQKEIRADDLALVGNSPIICHCDELVDFSDTAALVDQMDLVVSVDTSVAHVAGALGKPTWVLVAFVPDFRWMLGRSDSPWYRSVTVYRQRSPGDWPGVVDAVRADIGRRCAAP